MPVYVAMLRGINVGGHKRVKMDQLRKSFEALGFEQVKTYIQSGNVVFKAGKFSSAQLCKRIEEGLVKDLGFPVPIITRTRDEFGRVIQGNPLLKEREVDPERLHVTFLGDAPAASALKQLAAMTDAPDRSCCLGKEVYLYLPNGFSQSSLFRRPWERALAVLTTTRNWRTVNALYQMCLDVE